MEFDEIATIGTSEEINVLKSSDQWRSGSGNWAIAFSAVYGGGFCAEWYCYTTVTAYYRITTTKSDSKTVDGSENISKVDYSFAIGK